jgi:hypothetical protein
MANSIHGAAGQMRKLGVRKKALSLVSCRSQIAVVYCDFPTDGRIQMTTRELAGKLVRLVIVFLDACVCITSLSNTQPASGAGTSPPRYPQRSGHWGLRLMNP